MKDFLDMTLKAQVIKVIDKLDFIKIKNNCASKDTIKKVKTNPQTMRKYLSLMRLVPRVYKEL